MTKAQIKQFMRALEAKRAELTREIGGCRERLAVDPASDPMDQVCGLTDRDLAGRDLDRLDALLRLVESALDKIPAGTFGVCARCGEDIPAKRLQALPWSVYCIACQERVERAKRYEEVTDLKPRYAIAS